jgi:carbonic anhydrase
MTTNAISAEEALQRLIDGNERFRHGNGRLLTFTSETLAGLTRGQQPHATILGCSDSRVPPEIVFDAGLGELFVIRVAGNVISPEVTGSIQYAVSHLRTPLIVVMGHEGCGAVHAALATKLEGARHLSRIQVLVDGLMPGLAEVGAEMDPEHRLAKAVEANVRWTIHQILETPEAKARQAEGWIKLVGGVYEMETGKVRLLDEDGQVVGMKKRAP